MIKTDHLEDIGHAEKYWRIEQTRSGGYELVVPTELNEEVKRFMGSKDFEMDVIKEGEDTLWITLTPKKSGENKGKKTH
jgi:hypothetical protein